MAGSVYLADTTVYVVRGRDARVRDRFERLLSEGRLATTRQHRHFRLPDLIIAAATEQHGAVVLHYDADYDRIASVTGQPVEWVVPRGSV